MTIREAIIPGPWSDRITFSPGVRVGNLLFISGTTATDDNRRSSASATSSSRPGRSSASSPRFSRPPARASTTSSRRPTIS
ncbi:MAG: hypothetical protein WDO24_28200 [Pseudomonadota bacterium]